MLIFSDFKPWKMTGFDEIDNGSQRFQVKMYIFVFCF